MRPNSRVQIGEPPTGSSLPESESGAGTRAALAGLLHTIGSHIDRDARPRLTRKLLGIVSAIIFLSAVGVRLLCWQDSYAEISQGGSWHSAIARHYQSEARRMLNEGGVLLPNSPVDPGDARLILHPPGYSALMAGVFGLFGDSIAAMRVVQIVADGLSAVMILLIALELVSSSIAVISALLVALSPHLAFYSLWISPDTLCVLPVLAAIYLIIRASDRPRFLPIVASGALIGLSCWLRSNALLLAPFLGILFILLFKRGNRLRMGAALVGSLLVTISPITIRNFILYRQFIPLSLGAGITLVEGIADYDQDLRFGMPLTDDEAARTDAQWFSRPDYASNLWTPDGVERDRERFSRGAAIARSNPGWFFGAMIQRSAFMLRYNDSRKHNWPFTTSTVPIVSGEATFAHQLPLSTETMHPVWSSDPDEFLSGCSVISTTARATLADDGQSIQLTGGGSAFEDQMASATIAVSEGKDYLMTVPIEVDHRHLAAKITTEDRRIALASIIVPGVDEQDRKRAREGSKRRTQPAEVDVDPNKEGRMYEIQIPFASGKWNDVRLVLSNNGSGPASVAHIGRVELIELGATPNIWTQYPRSLVRALQRSLFATTRMVPLIIIGIILLASARRSRALAIVIAVPVYYLCTQSALHTEYRYILAIHYFLFVMAAVTVSSLGTVMGLTGRWIAKQFASSGKGSVVYNPQPSAGRNV